MTFTFVIFSKEDSKNDGSEWTNVGYLVSSLKKLKNLDVSVKLYHKNKVDNAVEEITKLNPDVIGLSVLQMNYEASMSFVRKIKKKLPNVHITLGNKEPTYYPNQILEEFSEVNSIIIGEGEETIHELCYRLMKNVDLKGCKGLFYRNEDGKIIQNLPRPFIEDVDSIDFPDRSFMTNNDNMFYLVASRGCTGHCTYCCAPSTGGQPGSCLRVRSIENVLDEIEMLVNKYGMKYLVFSDSALCDNFGDIIEEYNKLYEGFKSRNFQLRFQFNVRADMINHNSIYILNKLVTIGLDRIFIGIESGNSADLKLYGKKASVDDNNNALNLLRDYNVPFDYGFIMFNPYSDFDRLRENIRFLQKNQLPVMFETLSHGLHIHSGTPMLKKLHKDGLLKCDINRPIANRWDYSFVDKHVENAFNIMRSIEKIYPVNKEKIVKTKSLYKNCVAYGYKDVKGRFEKFDKTLNEFLIANTNISLEIAEYILYCSECNYDDYEKMDSYVDERFKILKELWNIVENYKSPVALDLYRKGILFA